MLGQPAEKSNVGSLLLSPITGSLNSLDWLHNLIHPTTITLPATNLNDQRFYVHLYQYPVIFPSPVLHSLKPFRHACNFFVDELLSYISLSFIYQLFCSCIIPMRVFAKSLFHRLPTVFDRGQIWRIMTVEIGLWIILFLPGAYNFGLPRSVLPIYILL